MEGTGRRGAAGRSEGLRGARRRDRLHRADRFSRGRRRVAWSQPRCHAQDPRHSAALPAHVGRGAAPPVVIVPSVDVRGGQVAYRGAVGADVAPSDLASRYVSEGADELHLVDLDGAERGDYANADLLADIARTAGVPCRLAGGISSLAKAEDAIAAGFAGVLFSSAVFGDDILLRRVARLGDRAIVEIEAARGVLAPRGGDADLVRRA
ncbi:MAG: hypothetical protein E6I19_13075, partial [Chloroflexi bacterium]